MAVRTAHRPEHLKYLDSFGNRVKLAGALLADDGTTPAGSLLIVECHDRNEAEAFAAGDPYAQAGLFAEVTIQAFRQARP